MRDLVSSPLRGFEASTWGVIVVNGLGGLLVALVIKYADGLAKNLATASSIVATTFVGHWLFGGPMSSSIIIGALIVIVSGYNYQNVA